MVTLYPTPVVLGLELHLRALFVNGTYPQYPELEFVKISIENVQSVNTQILPIRCRTHVLGQELNATWIDKNTIVCSTETSLKINDFCIELSYNNGESWVYDCTTQTSLLSTQIDQILWESQTFYQKNGENAVRFNLACFWYISPLTHEICHEIDGNNV